MMLLPTFVAVVVTLLMLLVVFVWFPMREHEMPESFEMKTEGEASETEPNEEMMVAVELVEEGGEGGAQPKEDEANAMVVESTTLDDTQDRAAEAQSAASPPPPFSFSPSSQPNNNDNTSSLMTHPLTRRAKVVVFALVLLLLSLSNFLRLELWAVSALFALIMLGIDLYIYHCDKKSLLSFLGQVYARVPWAIAPFLLCMFILMRVLSDVGFTGRFAEVMIGAAGPNVWTQSLVFGFVSSGLVNVLNDLPSSVLWANMLPELCTHYSPGPFQVVLHALLVGVNPGCYLTIIGKKGDGEREGREWRVEGAVFHLHIYIYQNHRRIGRAYLAERHPLATGLQALNRAQRVGLVFLWPARPRASHALYVPGNCGSVLLRVIDRKTNLLQAWAKTKCNGAIPRMCNMDKLCRKSESTMLKTSNKTHAPTTSPLSMANVAVAVLHPALPHHMLLPTSYVPHRCTPTTPHNHSHDDAPSLGRFAAPAGVAGPSWSSFRPSHGSPST